jgi:hypothetical protein
LNFLNSCDHVTKRNEPNSLVLAPSDGPIERLLHIIDGARGSKEAGTKKKVEGAKSRGMLNKFGITVAMNWPARVARSYCVKRPKGIELRLVHSASV